MEKPVHYLESEIRALAQSDPKVDNFLTHTAGDGLWCLDMENPEIEWMDTTFWEMLGYDPDEKEHLSSEWMKCIHPDDIEIALKHFELHCADETFPFDHIVRYFHKSGTILWFQSRGIAIRDTVGNPLRMLGAHKDLTALKKPDNLQLPSVKQYLEQIYEARTRSLQESNDRLKAVFENIVEAVIVINDRGLITHWSISAEKTFGFTPEEAVGKNVSMLMPNPYRDQHDQYLRNYLQSGKGKIIGIGREVQAMRKDGTIFPAELSIGDTKNPHFRQFIGVIRDISDQKAAQTKLEEAARAAHKANEAKSSFLASMSHEFRTPLNAIMGYSELLSGPRSANIVDEKKREYLLDIHAAGSHLLSLVNDILDLSRIESGKEQPSVTSIDVTSLIAQVVDMVRVLADRNWITIETHVHSGAKTLNADHRHMIQILVNLLSNAIKFNEKGGIVKLSARPLTDHGLAFEVADNGFGIDPADQDRIFDSFERTDDVHVRRTGGTGLGLALVKRLTELNGGNITLTSAVGEGTTVAIAFPKN
ncbi:sensor histidine kinase [Sneathiella chinensis]|uniref:histidine kinase n=1 Tax=Sneathiella chinensis TaxID=349750 RepID=A0ABQ5U2D9_9PROT|nr:PAS domain S-box protein [Sneathiella chinensis]GLQ06347.1 hypothetical protein GCM10007924_15680 [Sneathiella chinensis]